MPDQTEPDPFMLAIPIALHELAKLLRYTIPVEGRRYMSDYEAQCAAAEAIRALSGLLEHLNL